MYVKKIKRKCGVKGCKNNESYMISKSSEIGNSVIICKDCLESALQAVNNYKEVKKTSPSDTENPPALFFGEELKRMSEESTTQPPVPEADTTDSETEVPDESQSKLICPKCGKEFKTEQGYNKHCSVCSGSVEK